MIDAGVEAAMRELADLAPLHQAKSLAALDAVSAALPDVPAVACFDTAFHATLPGGGVDLRAAGAAGASVSACAATASTASPTPGSRAARRSCSGATPTGLRLVSAHLGAGASLCAIAGGRSVDTTMGFTPLEGLVMATRSGSVDPGLLLWLLDHAGLSPGEVADALEHESGLLGLAGSADMREVLARAGDGEQPSRLALDVYLHRLRAAIAAMAAALGGLDALVFTGGVGARSPAVRELTAAGLGFLGVGVDRGRNDDVFDDADVSADDAAVRTLVVSPREDLEIARQSRAALRRG